MPSFITKPRFVTAVQWYEPDFWPTSYSTPDGRSGYEDVILIDKGQAIIITGKKNQIPTALKNGDWLVRETSDDDYNVYSDAEFKQLFEPVF